MSKLVIPVLTLSEAKVLLRWLTQHPVTCDLEETALAKLELAVKEAEG